LKNNTLLKGIMIILMLYLKKNKQN